MGSSLGFSKTYLTPESNVNEKEFLHGVLLVHIYEACQLPNMESWLTQLVNKSDITDAFVDVILDKTRIIRTKVVENSFDPKWDENFRVELCHEVDKVIFSVKDKDHAYSEYIGCVEIEANTLLQGQPVEGWFPIKDNSKSKNAKLRLRIEFHSRQVLEKTYYVDSYFPVRKGNRVTLYQDSICPANLKIFQNSVRVDGLSHTPPSCWEDVYNALLDARHFICICGWSVFHGLRLLRGADSRDERTLGEILIAKSNENVTVQVMLWMERTDMMGTFGVETTNYFKNTRVQCCLTPRDMNINDFSDVWNQQWNNTAYSHHQKCIILDQTDHNSIDGRRRLTAFVGGLDLAKGRWDTPEHWFFKSLRDEHADDFLNNCTTASVEGFGPREPWHDIHARVDGPAAIDVLDNFVERWKKQGLGSTDPQTTIYCDPNKINIYSVPLSLPQLTWNCQVFRSITSDSALVDPGKIRILNSKKGRIVDDSICQAYIQLIRNADEFIYIENQYFLGSAYNWTSDTAVNCHHTIPMEIAQKICEKILNGQRFVAYILIPMFSEGDPTSQVIQEILAWQYRTIEMMYLKVGRAIRAAGISEGSPGSNPTDWLVFMCLGKKEKPEDVPSEILATPPPGSVADKLRRTRRFMIYVHSKMMIVDDSYIILGSANVNQRSMGGNRDTEIAIGAWQPAFIGPSAYGDVSTFRCSLWNEHFRTFEEVFRQPASLACVNRVKEMCSYNWKLYTDSCDEETPGQILPYPYNVEANGTISSISEGDIFLDYPYTARIFGSKSMIMPDKLTT